MSGNSASGNSASGNSASGNSMSRRTVLAGLGGAGVLVATLEVPLARAAGAAPVESSGVTTVVLELTDLQVLRVFDENRTQIGHRLVANIVDGGASVGTLTGTQIGGSLMVHEAVVGDSVLLGMGSGERFAVIGSVGAFAGATGGYVIELDPEGTGDRARGRLAFERNGD